MNISLKEWKFLVDFMITDPNLLWFHVINDMAGKNHIFDSAMIFAAVYIIYILCFYLVYLWFIRSEYRQEALFAGYAALLGLGINFIISLFYFHPRPFMIPTGVLLIEHVPRTSFPSDHATIMFSISLMFLAFKDLRRSGSILFILSFISGLARIYSGLHFPTDIAGSLHVALFSIFIVLVLKKYLIPINCLLIVRFNTYVGNISKLILERRNKYG
jgi:undecaprenyl-diphosphatase